MQMVNYRFFEGMVKLSSTECPVLKIPLSTHKNGCSPKDVLKNIGCT
jgi:hypothetical protein